MAKSLPSNATPTMLEWARKQNRLLPADVAVAMKCSEDRVLEWESGDATPTFPQLRKLASQYRFPLMVFYLKAPPTGFSIKKIKDFRRLATSSPDEFSRELLRALRAAHDRQTWAANLLEDGGYPECSLVGSAEIRMGHTAVASQLRNALGVKLSEQIAATNERKAYLLWRRHCEACGVFVFQASGVPVEQMRGCALPNRYAPVALVNTRDADAAKTYTLIHELVHIALNSGAITGGGSDDFVLDPSFDIERFCNSTAAEVLVPKDDLINFVPGNWKRRPLESIQDAARRYRVSRSVIGIRFIETDLASKSEINELWPSLQSKSIRKGGPVDQEVKAINRTGEAFARLAVGAYHSGEIHGGELSRLLRLSLKYLPPLESQLYPNRRTA